MKAEQKVDMIGVLGSVNIDLVCQVPRLPRRGETLRALSFARYPGGKGANQAVAAARLGARVAFFGKVGDDHFGSELLRSLQESYVDVEGVECECNTPSGVATIWVTKTGDNIIVIISGANGLVDRSYVDRVLPRLAAARVILLQLEIPLETVAYLLRQLPVETPLVILDPAPAQDLSNLPLERVDIITPNRGELYALTGEEDLEKAAQKLLARGVGNVVCKAGAEGAYLFNKNGRRHFPAFPVKVVDSTAAGDAFNGALAVALTEGFSLEESIRWANAAGALACTRPGAQPSLPFREELERFLAEHS